MLKRNLIRLSKSDVWTRSMVSSVDQSEVNKFDRLSASSHDWYSSSIMKPLRAMNRLRVPLICNQFQTNSNDSNSPLAGLTFLDVGCGGGLLSHPLARLGAKVIGLDANQHAIASAKKYCNRFHSDLQDRLQFQVGSLEQIESKQFESKFDAVIASEVLEHVSDVPSILKSACGVLKKNGKLIITTINQSVFAYVGAILLAENVFSLAPKGTHSYDKLVLLNGLEILLQENGFEVDLVHGMCFNPITGQWKWSFDTNVNYALVATKRVD